MARRSDDDVIGGEDNFDLYAKQKPGRREAQESGRGTNHGVAADQLRAFIERIERLEEEKQAIADDIKEVYAEAKGNGFDTKVMRAVVKRRKADRNEVAEFEAILDLYLHALGMIDKDLPDYGEDD